MKTDTERYRDDQLLRTEGWKLYSKADGKRFYVSPYDGKVYLETHALKIEETASAERAEAAEKERQEAMVEGWRKSIDWQPPVDEAFPPKKTPKKLKGKKSGDTSKKTIMEELGF